MNRNEFKLSGILLGASLACFANGVMAQSSTQIYGVLDVWGGRSQTSGAGPSTSVINSGGMQTSYIGFGGTEDLGGGLRTIYALEAYLQLDTGAAGRSATDAMFSRNAFVGLSGSLGEIKGGRILNPLFVATAQTNPFGGSIRFAPLLAQIWSVPMGRAVSGDTGWDNALSYTTPVWGGFKLAGYVGLGETAFGTSTNNSGTTLNFNSGPAAATITVQRARVGPGLVQIGQSEQMTYFAGGSYDFGVAKAFASYDTANTNLPDLKAKTAQAGVSVPAGQGNVLFSWAQTRNSGTGLTDTKRDTGAIGYDYFLSKLTDLYAVAQYDKLSGFNSAETYAVGMRLRF
jgi:predicted porin